ncbi:hypothetical protein Ancab_003943 [Ancistrocladus abbreviatus]
MARLLKSLGVVDPKAQHLQCPDHPLVYIPGARIKTKRLVAWTGDASATLPIQRRRGYGGDNASRSVADHVTAKRPSSSRPLISQEGGMAKPSDGPTSSCQ